MGLAPALPHPACVAAVAWPAWHGAAQARSDPLASAFFFS
jgi:hypothetical protein